MNKQRVLGMLGFAQRAGHVVTGEPVVLSKIRNNKAILVFLASDAAINTTKRITDKAHFYHIQLETSFSTDELSQAVGKINRKVIAVCDRQFAKTMVDALIE